MKRSLSPVLGALGFLLVWQLACWVRLADPILLPSPGQTWHDSWAALAHGSLGHDVWRTGLRTVESFALAGLVGVPLGVVLGARPGLYRALEFVIDFFRSTPASALFPLFLLLFGVGEATKIAVAAFGAALVILFNAAYGVMQARQTRVLAVRVMGASGFRILTDVLVWEALPQIVVGMRNGVSIALVIIVVAEMFIGSTDGLGYRIINAQMVFDSGLMYGAIFATGALGFAFNLLFLAAGARFIHWTGR